MTCVCARGRWEVTCAGACDHFGSRRARTFACFVPFAFMSVEVFFVVFVLILIGCAFGWCAHAKASIVLAKREEKAQTKNKQRALSPLHEGPRLR